MNFLLFSGISTQDDDLLAKLIANKSLKKSILFLKKISWERVDL